MDNSPTALFDSYEQDFKQIIQSIRGKLDGDAQDAQGEQRKADLRRVEMELDEADEMVRSVAVSLWMRAGGEAWLPRSVAVGSYAL